MWPSFSIPTEEKLTEFLQSKRDKAFTYANVGGSRNQFQKGFDNDSSSIFLGEGEEIWNNAKKALKNWEHFPAPWTLIYPNKTPIEKSEIVAVLFRLFGIWWINSARIVYTIEEEGKFGFAYGTLPGHLEIGEECFWIEKDESGAIYYHIKAFSKPAYWFVWLAYPLARIFQKRFVRDSLSTMKKLSNKEKEASV